MNLFDSHAHYNDEKFDIDRDEIIKETLKNDVSNFIVAGYSIESSIKAVEIVKKYENAYAIVGISPNDLEQIKTEEDIENNIKELEKLILENNKKEKKIVAIGEIGLDYYWTKDNINLQNRIFIKQIELANTLNLPIVIHTRDAVNDTLKILKEHPVIKKGIFHCCPLNRELVKEGLKLGFYISLSGVITFKNAKNANEIIEMISEDKLLIETDSPYLSPEPVRGTRNNCMNVKYVAKKIADVKAKNIEEIADITNKRSMRLDSRAVLRSNYLRFQLPTSNFKLPYKLQFACSKLVLSAYKYNVAVYIKKN